MTEPIKIVGLGEALFDVFDGRQVLGGAPLNVAVQAHALASHLEIGTGVVASRVGDDELGARLRADVASREMPTAWLQTDSEHPTGTVEVTLLDGEPRYEIMPDVAWDFLEANSDFLSLADECQAVCFGTLAQRSKQSCQAIRAFLSRANRAIRLFDCNLRQQYFNADILTQSFELATVAKLNEAELTRVVQILIDGGMLAAGTPSSDGSSADFTRDAQHLLETFNLRALVLTRGTAGTTLFSNQGLTSGEPVSYEREEDADSVGAGDACSAGILIGILLNWPDDRTISLANHLGAFVASQPGATPELPAEITGLLK